MSYRKLPNQGFKKWHKYNHLSYLKNGRMDNNELATHVNDLKG